VNCQETRKLLPELREDVVPDVQRGPLETHLAGCADCRAASDEAKNLDVLLRKAVRVPEPPAAFWRKLESRALQTSGRRGWILLGTIGAAAALLLGLGVFALTRPDPAPAPAPREDVAKEPPAPVVKPEPPRPPAPPPAPAPLPPPARSLAILPGDPGYLERLTDENIEVGLADTASDRVLGLIRAAVPEDDLDAVVDGRVAELLKAGPRAVSEAKALIREVAWRRVEDVQRYTVERIAELRTSPEGQEGMRAFLEKRKPYWVP